jgi:hypothetical protein
MMDEMKVTVVALTKSNGMKYLNLRVGDIIFERINAGLSKISNAVSSDYICWVNFDMTLHRNEERIILGSESLNSILTVSHQIITTYAENPGVNEYYVDIDVDALTQISSDLP